MSYRLGVDVGGTFTDLLLIEESSGRTHRAKVPSTPSDPSLGVLAGIDRICGQAGIDPGRISNVLHGTTIATNTILEGKGARVGVITTEGFRFLLHTARSHIPGGLGGWIIHPKPEPLAPLELTVEVRERIDKRGEIIVPLDEQHLQDALSFLCGRGVDAITVALINSYVDDSHERRIQDVVHREMPGIPVSISSAVLPEMLEYERAQTGVVNSYVRPVVAGYLANLDREMAGREMTAHLHILRSDGGLASTEGCRELPVSILMSGPAGGVTGALWIASQSGYSHLLTLDMGGTSTDVALIEDGAPRLRRETTVGDVTVRASSLDVPHRRCGRRLHRARARDHEGLAGRARERRRRARPGPLRQGGRAAHGHRCARGPGALSERGSRRRDGAGPGRRRTERFGPSQMPSASTCTGRHAEFSTSRTRPCSVRFAESPSSRATIRETSA